MTLGKIMLIGEAWGREEAEEGRPFVGSSGRLLRGLLSQSGLRFDDCYVTNVFNFQPRGRFPDNDLKNICGPKEEALPHLPPLVKGRYVRAEFGSELSRLYQEIARETPTLIVALGATPSWALLGTTGIKKLRGAPSLTNGGALLAAGKPIKVLPTYHPAAIMRDYTLRPTVLADLAKARREAEFPELRRPARNIWIAPTLEDLFTFEQDFIAPSPDLSTDIETIGPIITCVGFSPTPSLSIVVPFLDAIKSDGNYWPDLQSELIAWDFIRRWCSWTVPMSIGRRLGIEYPYGYKRGVGQNTLYDIHRLWRSMGILLHDEDDTMLAHHAMQPELEKSLGYLATIYTDELAWKFMRAKHETLKKED